MTTSFYDLSVTPFLQTMNAVAGFLDRSARHCAATGGHPDSLVDVRLFPDMAPFHFQIEALTHHAVWGVLTAKTGAFTPPGLIGSMPFTDLQAMVTQAETALKAFDPEEVNGWAGRALDLVIGPRRMRFTSETFIW